MSDDKEDTAGQSGSMNVGDDELRQILGDDYDAVVSPTNEAEPASAPGTLADASATAGASPSFGDAPVKKMTPEEEERWTRQMEQELAEQAAGTSSAQPVRSASTPPAFPVQPVHFGQLEELEQVHEGNIELLLDVKLPISVELGRTEMLVKEILECGPGTVVELNKLAGEPVDVFVNGRMIAQGEVVVVDEHFGVRVTNLLSPRERVKSLA